MIETSYLVIEHEYLHTLFTYKANRLPFILLSATRVINRIMIYTYLYLITLLSRVHCEAILSCLLQFINLLWAIYVNFNNMIHLNVCNGYRSGVFSNTIYIKACLVYVRLLIQDKWIKSSALSILNSFVDLRNCM